MAQSSNPKRVVVIGGGLAGLASAVELQGKGAAVTIIEANDHLGGKMNVLSESGYTFDMGPTILTLPEVLCGIIRRSGNNVPDLIDLVRLDPQWRCHFEDGTSLDLHQSVDDMAGYLETQLPGTDAATGYRSFIEYSRRMNRLSRSVFFYKDVGGIRDVMRSTPAMDKQIMADAMAMRLHSTVGATIGKHVKEPHVAQIMEHFLQYVGSSPFLAPAILTMIASAQVDQGCWYSMGGTRMVARSLIALADQLGVEALTGTRVKRILTQNGRVTSVRTDDGKTIECDAVISNCDVQRTYRDLLGSPQGIRAQTKIARAHKPACSGVVLYLGLDRQYEHLLHHNFLFSNNSEEEFGDIYRRGIPARDPTLYIAAPSRTDPDQAPLGGEALYILVHTPYIRKGHEWNKPGGMLEQYRPVIMDKLSRFGMDDIEDHIVVERSLTPTGIESIYNAEGGAIYGLASHGKLGGGFKPRNSSPVGGLFVAGGSANPGPGVPMVLMSGVTAAQAASAHLDLQVTDLTETSHAPTADEIASPHAVAVT
jgi:diapolycopene oxygenase